MLVRVDGTPLAALDNPTPTRVKRGQAYAALVDARRRKGATAPKEYLREAVDTAALSRQYSMDAARAPRIVQGTFVVPLGVSARRYRDIRNDAIGRFVRAMDTQGWEAVIDAGHRIDVLPGVYPYRDLATGLDMLDRREFIVRVWFRFRNPQPLKLEVPESLLEPKVYRS